MGQAEHMIEFYHGTALVCAGMAFVFFAAAVVLFFGFRIPRTLDILSGRRARRSIRKLRRELEGKQEIKREPERRAGTGAEGDETTVFLKKA